MPEYNYDKGDCDSFNKFFPQIVMLIVLFGLEMVLVVENTIRKKMTLMQRNAMRFIIHHGLEIEFAMGENMIYQDVALMQGVQ